MNDFQLKKGKNDSEFGKWVKEKTVRQKIWIKVWKWISRPFRSYGTSVSELVCEDFPQSDPKFYNPKKNGTGHGKRKARWPRENALAHYNAHYARLASMQDEDETRESTRE